MRVRFLPYASIDKSSWDRCNDAAPNGSVYTGSAYLDALSPHWDGLVADDYAFVMPLTWNRKYRIHYLFQPALSAGGGVIGAGTIDGALVREFLEAIPRKFRYWDFSLNRANAFQVPGYPFYTRMNFVLPTNGGTHYSENHQRNIRKAEAGGLQYGPCTLAVVIRLAQLQPGSDPGREAFGRFEGWAQRAGNGASKDTSAGGVVTRAVFDPRHEALAAAAFLFSHGRAYYVLVGNHPEGRNQGASHYLIDRFIMEYPGLALDFEGSDIPGLAAFYSGFGAVQEPYPAIRLNRLPWALRWAKRP